MHRTIRHVFTAPWAARRVFTASVLDAIQQAIRESEARHGGEIRFAVESAIDVHKVARGISPRERALEVFSELRVWDTEANNGVLIYVLWAERDVEIVADRGYNGKISAAQWTEICRTMEKAFRAGDFRRGAIEGVQAVGALVGQYYPASDHNELPDRPVML